MPRKQAKTLVINGHIEFLTFQATVVDRRFSRLEKIIIKDLEFDGGDAFYWCQQALDHPNLPVLRFIDFWIEDILVSP